MTDEIRDRSNPPPPAAPASFEMNYPTVISLLYLASFFTGVTAIVGGILAYVWRGEAGQEAWTESHYAYHIRTFWIGLIGTALGFVTLLVLIGFVILLAAAVLVIARSVMAIVAAQKHEPMPNPDSWTI